MADSYYDRGSKQGHTTGGRVGGGWRRNSLGVVLVIASQNELLELVSTLYRSIII